MFAHYGESCACCGTADDLTIDHIDGDGREHRIELFGNADSVSTRFYRWLIEQGFPGGLQTLCAPCNASKRDGDHCRLWHGDPAFARCSKCEQVKPVGEFGGYARKRNGRNSWCRACQRDRKAAASPEAA